MADEIITFMTYNVGNELLDPAALVQGLREVEAGVVGLQELTVPQAEAIRRELAGRFPYQALFGAGIPGKGLLSRYPLRQTRQLHIYPHRPDLESYVEIGGRPLRIIVAHPLPPRFHRRGWAFTEATRRHVATLTELAASGEPTVLMGDFNMLQRDRRHSHLRQSGLTDVFHAVGQGQGFTLPMRVGRVRTIPFMRVDYIWISTHFRPVAAWIGPHAGSDHLPVLAKVAWQEE